MLSAGSLRTMKTTVLARCMEDFGQENVFFGSKTVVLVHYCMVHNAYHTKLNLNFIITRKNDANVAKKVNTRLTTVFMAIFVLAERLLTSATVHSRPIENNWTS